MLHPRLYFEDLVRGLGNSKRSQEGVYDDGTLELSGLDGFCWP